MEGACTHLLSAHCSQFRMMIVTHNSPLDNMDTSTKMTWGQAEAGECDNSSSNDMEVIMNQSYQDTEQVCTFELDISLAVCHDIHPYSRVNVSNVEVPLNFSCSDMDLLDWDNFEVTSP